MKTIVATGYMKKLHDSARDTLERGSRAIAKAGDATRNEATLALPPEARASRTSWKELAITRRYNSYAGLYAVGGLSKSGCWTVSMTPVAALGDAGAKRPS